MQSRPILLISASHFGQTTLVAQRIAAVLRERGFVVEEVAATDLRPDVALDGYAGVVIGSRVQFGRHARRIERFATARHQALDALPNAFFSVSMSAAGGEKERAEAHRVVADFEARTGWHPKRTTEVPGKLHYTKYNFLLRFVMKRISRAEGAATDTSRDWEYTDWAQVEAFANTFATDLEEAAHAEAVPA